jgi:Saf4/Yju2 protein
MSERKVLTKYYPPDFDPRLLDKRVKRSGPSKLPQVRLMTPFSMRCTRCGTFIPKSRKFNARKETPREEVYLGIQKYRFYFHCPACHGEIIFKTDPKNMDYEAESGAVRNFEPWREGHVEETDEQRLRRLEEEAGDIEEEVDPMRDMEQKLQEAQREMAVADALDEIRASNARHERTAAADKTEAQAGAKDEKDSERERQEKEDEAAAKEAFRRAREAASAAAEQDEVMEVTVKPVEQKPEAASQPVPVFKRTIKPKKNLSAALGIKKKAS